MKKLAACALTLLAPALVLSTGAGAGDQQDAGEKVIRAVAHLHPRSGSKVHGVIHFVQQGDTVKITGKVEGLEPGEHAFHIHEFGDCSDAKALKAGSHYNPEHKHHGGPHDEDRHVGDLGNIKADDQGNAEVSVTDKMIKLHGPHSIIGRSLIIHANPDDFKTQQPPGNAGARIACAVIGIAKDDTGEK